MTYSRVYIISSRCGGRFNAERSREPVSSWASLRGQQLVASLQVSQFLPIWVSLNMVYTHFQWQFFGANFLVNQWIFRGFPLNFQTSPHIPPHTEVSINGGTPKSSVSSSDFPWNKASSYWSTPMSHISPYLPKHVTPSRWRAHLHSPPLLHAEIIAEPVAASASTFQFCQGDEVNFAALLGSKVGLLYVVHCLWWNDSTEQLNGGLWTNHSSTMGITIREPTRRGLGTSWLKTEHSSAGAFQLSCWRRSGYWVPMGTPKSHGVYHVLLTLINLFSVI